MSKAQLSLGLLFSLPIAMALIYDTGGGKTAVFGTFAAVQIFTYAAMSLSARIKIHCVRCIMEPFLMVPIAVYLYLQALSYFFQGTYINQQFLFHVSLTTLLETFTIYYELVIAFAFWIVVVGLVTFAFRHEHRINRLPARFLIPALILSPLLDPTLRQAGMASVRAAVNSTSVAVESIEWDALALNRQAIEPQRLAASPGRNLVFIFLEGLERIYTDPRLFPELTPELNALEEQGRGLEHLEQVSGSEWTMGGLVSSLCGTPLLYESAIGGNSVMFTRFLDRTPCLPDILAAAGYQQVFMGGASTLFAGKGDFLEQHHYDRVLGREELRPRLPDPSYLGEWGLFDDSLFALAAGRYAELAETGRPFNLTLLTVDTHHPSGEVSGSCPPYPAIDNSILHAVHCTDYLLGRFLQRIRRHPAFEDTVVVIASDHLAMRNEALPLFPENYERRLLFTVLNAGADIQDPSGAVPMDIAPTVLSLLEVDHNADFLAGRDLSAAGDYRLRVNPRDPLRNNIIAHLNSVYLSSSAGTPAAPLYTLADNGAGGIEFSGDIADFKFRGSSLEFDVVGEDPYLVLPPFDSPADRTPQLQLELESPAAGFVDVYYSASRKGVFLESAKLTQNIGPGWSELGFAFPRAIEVDRIRIDPGNRKGHYRIRSIRVLETE